MRADTCLTKMMIDLVQDTLSTSDLRRLEEDVTTASLPDSFGILADPTLAKLITEQLGEPDLTKCVTRPLTWDSQLYGPSVQLNPAEQCLHLLWQDLRTRLARKLDAIAMRTQFASKGAIFCFFGRAKLSIIVEYTRSGGGAARLRPLISHPDPAAVFELTNLLHDASPEVRNAIKNTAFSVDKLIYHRGCIIHVERQREDVFGPTIDTVLLGELLAEWLQALPVDRKVSALEVGPGSGLLSVLLGVSEHVRALTSVDLNGAAVGCTLKNLRINDVTLDARHQLARVRAERFAASEFTEPFDIVVCNPPYIPSAPRTGDGQMKEHGRAVGGLELCMQILESLPALLAPDGVLLMMASSLSVEEVMDSIPEGFEAIRALGDRDRRVPLDVDAIWQIPSWRQTLLEDQRIQQDADGVLWHELRPLWINRSEESK